MKQQLNFNSLLLAIIGFLVTFTAIEAHRLIQRIDQFADRLATIQARQQMNERRIDRLERSTDR